MFEEEKDIDKNQIDLLKELDKLCEDEFWSETFLLKAKKEKLKKIVEQYRKVLIGEEEESSKTKDTQEKKEGKVIYISIYQAQGQSILKWQAALNVLETCSFGRPIYEKEAFVRNLIKSKRNTENEGYVAVRVGDRDVFPGKLMDQLEQPIITVKPGSISPNNVVEFVHQNISRYQFVNQKLIIRE